MISKQLTFAAAMIAFVASASSAVADEKPIAPSTVWNLHYDDDSCVLRRAFGQGKDLVQLELRQFAPNDRLQVTIFGGPSIFRSLITEYRFEPSDKWRRADTPLGATFGDAKYRGSIFAASLTERPEGGDDLSTLEQIKTWAAADDAEAARVTGFSIRRPGAAIRLDTGPMAKPFEALKQCLTELTGHWGIDVEAQQTLIRRATPTNLPQVPRMMDYPPKMLAMGMQGLVNVRLDIDAKGGISACHIQMPLSDPAFQASTCADLQHALDFEPALDKDGKPIASYWTTRVIFMIG